VFGTDYPTPDGTCLRDYIHVTDLARAHVMALEFIASQRHSLVANLGTGRGHSVREIISAVENLIGSKVPVRFGARRHGDPPALVADPTVANRTLGWQAGEGIETIVASAWHWLRHRIDSEENFRAQVPS